MIITAGMLNVPASLSGAGLSTWSPLCWVAALMAPVGEEAEGQTPAQVASGSEGCAQAAQCGPESSVKCSLQPRAGFEWLGKRRCCQC